MALCDRLEAQQQERQTRHAALARASLSRFAEARTPDNLGFLFHNAYAIRSRLDLQASPSSPSHVQGKLVPQDPNDAPAEELSESRMMKPKLSAGDHGPPFEIPNAWHWKQLGQVSELINGDRSKNYPNKAEYVPKGVAWINTGHIEPDGTLSTESMHYITWKKFNSLRSGKVRPGRPGLLLTGPGNAWEDGDHHAICGKEPWLLSLVIVRLVETIDPKFAYQVLTSPLGREQIYQFDNGSAQPNLSANSVKKYWIPVPPLAEQHRIVAKVGQLMALVDQLEAQLAAAKTAGIELLNASISELLNPKRIEPLALRIAVGCHIVQKMARRKRYFGRTANMKERSTSRKPTSGSGPRGASDARGRRSFQIHGSISSSERRPKSTGSKPSRTKRATAATGRSSIARVRRYPRERNLRTRGLPRSSAPNLTDCSACLLTRPQKKPKSSQLCSPPGMTPFSTLISPPRDDDIIREVRDNWHISKHKRFDQNRLTGWLEWQRSNRLDPRGLPPRTAQQPQLL